MAIGFRGESSDFIWSFKSTRPPQTPPSQGGDSLVWNFRKMFDNYIWMCESKTYFPSFQSPDFVRARFEALKVFGAVLQKGVCEIGEACWVDWSTCPFWSCQRFLLQSDASYSQINFR